MNKAPEKEKPSLIPNLTFVTLLPKYTFLYFETIYVVDHALRIAQLKETTNMEARRASQASTSSRRASSISTPEPIRRASRSRSITTAVTPRLYENGDIKVISPIFPSTAQPSLRRRSSVVQKKRSWLKFLSYLIAPLLIGAALYTFLEYGLKRLQTGNVAFPEAVSGLLHKAISRKPAFDISNPGSIPGDFSILLDNAQDFADLDYRGRQIVLVLKREITRGDLFSLTKHGRTAVLNALYTRAKQFHTINNKMNMLTGNSRYLVHYIAKHTLPLMQDVTKLREEEPWYTAIKRFRPTHKYQQYFRNLAGVLDQKPYAIRRLTAELLSKLKAQKESFSGFHALVEKHNITSHLLVQRLTAYDSRISALLRDLMRYLEDFQTTQKFLKEQSELAVSTLEATPEEEIIPKGDLLYKFEDAVEGLKKAEEEQSGTLSWMKEYLEKQWDFKLGPRLLKRDLNLEDVKKGMKE